MVTEERNYEVRIGSVSSNERNERLFCSGGMKLTISGQNLDVVQKPMLKSIYNSSAHEFVTVSEKQTRKNDRKNLS